MDLLSLRLGGFNLATLAVAVGAFHLARVAFSFLILLRNTYLRPATNLAKFGAGKGAWAVVTGASDGIGKEFALQLARAKFNVVILARTKSKLDTLAAEIKAAGGSEVVVHPFDFSATDQPTWSALAAVLAPLNVSVLINNVAVNHAFPTPFAEEDPALLDSIVTVNVGAQVRLTRMLLPGMVAARRGLVINVGSIAGLVPSAYLAAYSGAKAFLRTWSRSLAEEVAPKGVRVQHVNTHFVATAMSKLRKATWLAPTPKAYVRSVIASAGANADGTPYPSHAIITWVLNTFVPEGAAIAKSRDMHLDIRRRALRKMAREAKRE
ncbi:NAD(P)-binding protein [Blyttiomyces helicus]|uniref:Very-long-chain 3-oxoacyl-CoA reductase n=1 Tax=Blyttiomyces helicus TaxID=388810 RepID=A0A4P9WDQ8_9FUNG|nr:NAD(P)-binding protein [Blyttiomyces helicus]|eukprot:RKO90492.1 NAD(P)-binding protein [Blyttiomyces helicus]